MKLSSRLFLLLLLIITKEIVDARANKLGTIVIQQATLNDFETAIRFNNQISQKHFKPIYIKHYAHLPIGQNTDYFLDLAKRNYTEWFYTCMIDPDNSSKLLLAYDNQRKKCIGLILFTHIQKTLEINLLYVHKKYRRLGIGRRLLDQASKTFKTINACSLYVLQRGNEESILFYKSLGFKDLGSSSINKNHYVFRSPAKDLFFK